MPTNEPELWTDGNGNYFHKCVGYYTIPLYTHPAELTDDEIVWLWADCEKTGTGATYINFARAILRKAQEK